MVQGEGYKKGFVDVDLEQPPQPPQPPHQQQQQQTVPGYVIVVGGVPAREPLCCCGLGFGWVLFILGFFLSIIPWYIGTILLFYYTLKKEKDLRERPGCIACAVAAFIITVIIIVKVTTGQPHWLYYYSDNQY